MVTVSLPQHLHSSLRPLVPLLPSTLSDRLQLYVKPTLEASATEIPHELLHDISRWAQNEDAKELLRREGLDPLQYSMISLLAGTITSPSAKLPPQTLLDPHLEAKRESSDRKAITALVNAVFSVVGVGAAAWWAAGNIGWKDEWKVLLALFAGLVVAISEGVLYVIYQSRGTRSTPPRKLRKKRRPGKKDDGPSEPPTPFLISEFPGDVSREGSTLVKRREGALGADDEDG